MNKIKYQLMLLVTSLALAGCATGPDIPLIFSGSNTAGISIGANATDQSADFVVGYKGYDFAVVPVTTMNPDGGEMQLGGTVGTGTFNDSFSVFGQFKMAASSDKTKSQSLGKFFATGMAAKRLADGYAMKMGDLDLNKNKAADQKDLTDAEKKLLALMDTQGSLQRAQLAMQHKQSEVLTQQQALQEKQVKSVVEVVNKSASSSNKEIEKGKRMYFAQYTSFGLVFVASPVDGGGGLTIGYKDRNVAVVPVVKRDFQGKPSPILSKSFAERLPGNDPSDYDAYSVLGQFEFNQDPGENAAIQVGLGKFFTTGQAAKWLSDGFAAKLGQEYVAPTEKNKSEDSPGEGDASGATKATEGGAN